MTVINNGVLEGVRQVGPKFRDASIAGGLPGVPLGYRLRGATTAGAPAAGTWKAGDQVPDRNGVIWTCTAGGTPGTWVQTGTVTGVTAADTSIVIGGTSAAPTVRTGTLDVIAADHPAAADWSNNSHKITSLANGSAATDAAALGQVVASVTAGDTSIVVGGTSTAPTVATGTLDVIAADHPPAANWSNNSKKITSLANGGAAQDAAAWGQTVSGILTTLGDLVYENSTPAPARLAGSTSATKNFLTQTGTGSVSAAPAWGTIAAGDLPTATTSTQGAVIIDGTASDIQPTSTAAVAGNKGQAADAKHVHVQNYGGLFGDGSDGSVTFDGTTTILGLVPSSNTYTMTRDIFCTSITINSGVTVKPAGFRIFCAGTVTNNGTISIIGVAGTGAGGGGGASATGSLGNGKGGGAGATGNGVAGTSSSGPGAGAGGGGGAGGTGTAGGAGTAGNNALTWEFRANPTAPAVPVAAVFVAVAGGAGGGGGGGDGTNSGGGGGAGGGAIMIAAYSVNNGSGTISVQGGAGGSPAAGNAGGGGGGGGGVIIIFTLSAWTAGTTNVTGGAAGTKAGTGANGVAGNNGTVLNVVII